SNAAAFACDGLLKPETLRTNCSAEAWISSSVAGGSKLNNVLMLRHIELALLRWQCSKPHPRRLSFRTVEGEEHGLAPAKSSRSRHWFRFRDRTRHRAGLCPRGRAGRRDRHQWRYGGRNGC